MIVVLLDLFLNSCYHKFMQQNQVAKFKTKSGWFRLLQYLDAVVPVHLRHSRFPILWKLAFFLTSNGNKLEIVTDQMSLNTNLDLSRVS